MEMELQRTQLGGWRPVYDTVLRQEETLESIVPDAMPDIARIVQAGATAMHRQKETTEGTARITGTARTSVLYMPEGGMEPCALEVSVPFLLSCDHPAIHGDCPVVVQLQVAGADAQLLNPRKILVRVELSVRLVVYSEERQEVSVGVVGQDPSLQILQQEGRDFVSADVLGKAFALSDVLRAPSSKPVPERLLCCRAKPGFAEAKVIGKKLVAKGQMELTALCWGGGGVNPMRFELPFSQVMDTRFDGEESLTSASVLLTGFNCRLRDEGELEVSMELLLQAVVAHERTLSLVTDLYSTAASLSVQYDQIPLTLLQDHGELRQLVRQQLPSAMDVKHVLDCSLTVGEVTQTAEEKGRITMTARGFLDVLFISEEDALCAVSYTIPVTCELPAAEGCGCSCGCGISGEVTAAPVSDGLEVRFEAVFSYRLTEAHPVSMVTSVLPGSEPEEGSVRPSVVVRRLPEGKGLWDVAKACGSTVEAILAANGLVSEDAVQGGILLIPRAR